MSAFLIPKNKLIAFLVNTVKRAERGKTMEFNEIKEFIEANKETNNDLKAYLQGFNTLSVEGVQKFVSENKDARAWMDSEKDKHSSKSLETWKINNLEKLIDDEVQKRNPTADPKDVKIKELEAKFEQMQKDAFKKELTNSAIKTATIKNLPTELVDFMLGADLDSTNKNIELFETAINDYVQKQVEARIQNNSYTPPKGGSNNNTELQSLQLEYDNAMKAGNMPLAISLKNKIVAIQNKK